MMEQYLTLSDGTVLNNSYAIEAGTTLWLYVYAEIDFGVLFAMLNDPEKVNGIRCVRYGDEQTVTGYTELYCITKETGGFYTAGIRK